MTEQTQCVQTGASTCPPPTRIQPAADISETLDAYVIEAALPGVKDEDLVVKVENRVLTLEGTATAAVPEGMRSLHRGFGDRVYRRAFRLATDVAAEGIQARLNQGILSISLPKAEHAKPRKIPVNIPEGATSNP